MQHIPVPVIERLAVFADDASLVLFASCCRWLWDCVGIQQRVWQQRYRQRYSLKDDAEAQWLSWYVRTLRVSDMLATYSNTAIDVLQLSDRDINWFRAFCHRRATSANWLRDKQHQLHDVVEVDDNVDDDGQHTVLQRISNGGRLVDECGIIEQCQPIGKPANMRYWRMRKPCHNKFNSSKTWCKLLASDLYAVMKPEETEYTIGDTRIPCAALVWPINRVSTMQPYVVPYPRTSPLEIRSRWLLLNDYRNVPKKHGSPELVIARVFDLATRQLCMGRIEIPPGPLFIQRTTENTATVFHATAGRSGDFSKKVISWAVWQLAVCQLEDNPRCLMQGKFIAPYLMALDCPVQRLDDERVLVASTSMAGYRISLNEVDDKTITLAVISTCSNGSTEFIDDQQPVWSKNIKLGAAMPIISSNAVVVISDDEISVYSLTDGTMLAQTNSDILESVLPSRGWRSLNNKRYTERLAILPNDAGCGNQVIDLIQPTNNKHIEVENNSSLTGLSAEVNTANALVMEYSDGYKVIDMSC